MRSILITTWLCLCSVPAFSQTFFSKVFNHDQPSTSMPVGIGTCRAICRLSDSGYLLSYGYYPIILEGMNSAKTQLVRTDSALNPLWRIDMAGLNVQTVPMPGGSCIVWGAQSGVHNVRKLDAAGNTTWNKNIRIDGWDGFAVESGVAIDGGIRFGGYAFNYGFVLLDNTLPFYIDIDTSGNVINSQALYYPSVATLNRVTDIVTDNSGNTFINGVGTTEAFLVKISATGAVLWAKEVNTDYVRPAINNLLPLADGSLFIAGEYNSYTAGNHRSFIGKLSSTGSLVWSKGFDTLFTVGKAGLQQLANGNVLVTNGAHIMECGLDGTLIWSKNLGGKIFQVGPAFFKAPDDWYFNAITRDSFSLVVFNTDSLGNGMCDAVDDTFTFGDPGLVFAASSASILPFGIYNYMAITGDIAVAQGYTDTCAGYFGGPVGGLDVVNTNRPSQTGLSVFPNPATSSVTVTAPYAISSIGVWNAYGQRLFTTTNTRKELVIDVAAWPAGVYFIRVNEAAFATFVKQ